MTTSSLRIIAVGIAVIFAVLTGLFTGMVGGGGPQCTSVDQPSTQAPARQESSPGTGRRGSGPGMGEKTPAGRQPDQQSSKDSDSAPVPGADMPNAPDGASGTEVQVEAAAVRPLAASGQSCGDTGFSVTAAMVGFLGALLAGGAAAALGFVGRAPIPPVGAVGTGTPPRAVDGDRSTLIQACIYVRDRVTSKALADRLGWALQEAGVSTLAPTGARFDPAHHEAGGSVGTEDPAKAGTIAAVEVPGYADRGLVVRAPVVTVYRRDSA